jgi:hypothetical protein
MNNPPAPDKPSTGPSSALRPRARLRPRVARASGDQPLVKGRDIDQQRLQATNGEPAVKRRKRSLPPDAPTEMPLHLANTPPATRVQSVEYQQAASVSAKRHTPRRTPALSPAGQAIAPVKRTFVDDGGDDGIPSSRELEQLALQHNEDIHEQLLQYKKKLSKLEAELVQERAFTEEAQTRVKQDMLIDILNEKTKLRKAEEAASIAKRLYEKEVSELKVKLDRADAKSLVERTQTISARNTAESYRRDAEHLQHVTDTLQADLEELRVVDTEDRRARKDERHDLPPAYGNLNDEARFPPYSQHADAGSIEVALLKCEIRRKFERKIEETLTDPKKGTSIFFALSVALEDVSQDLKTILDTAKDVHVSRTNAQGGRNNTQAPAPQLQPSDIAEQLIALKHRMPNAPDYTIDMIVVEMNKKRNRRLKKDHKPTQPTITLIQNANAAPYVADRILKLLLDLLWRTVSACELRPRSKMLNVLMLGSALPVIHTAVDEVLAAALLIAFSKSHPITAFQYYLTQLEILARKFTTFGLETTGHGNENGLTRYKFFSKTLLWLNEQVEKEREMRANEVQVGETSSGGENLDDNDGVSSRWEGSDAGIESDSDSD